MVSTTKIGSQEWATEDLKVTKFRNGEDIPLVMDGNKWAKTTTPAYCIAPNGSYLYNWYAVNDIRGIAPEGFHIPDNTEWNTLIDYLGGVGIAGNKLKSCPPFWNGDNSSGFSALPGGIRDFFDGTFRYAGEYGMWWSTNPANPTGSRAWGPLLDSKLLSMEWHNSQYGHSVRCIKDTGIN